MNAMRLRLVTAALALALAGLATLAAATPAHPPNIVLLLADDLGCGDPGCVLYRDGRPVRRDGYFTDLVADEAEQFIAANRDRPFFLYLPFTVPHSPFQGPDE